MNGTIEQARTVLAQLEQGLDTTRDETAAALRELIALAEDLFEDLGDYNTKIGRAAKAIGATGCPIEIRRNRDGSLDEVVAQNVFVHLEQMADNAWWMGVSTPDNAHLVHVNFYSQRVIEAEAEDQHVDEE